MRSPKAWDQGSVQLGEMSTMNQARSISQTTSMPDGALVTRWAYQDIGSDETLLHSIEPSLVDMKELLSIRISQIDNQTDYMLDGRTFVSTSRHTKATVHDLADRFCIGPGLLEIKY